MISLKITRIGKRTNIQYMTTDKTRHFAKNFAKEVISAVPKTQGQEIVIVLKDKPVKRMLREFVEMSIDDMKLNFSMILKGGKPWEKPKKIESYLSGEEFRLISHGIKINKKEGSFVQRIASALQNLQNKG